MSVRFLWRSSAFLSLLLPDWSNRNRVLRLCLRCSVLSASCLADLQEVKGGGYIYIWNGISTELIFNIFWFYGWSSLTLALLLQFGKIAFVDVVDESSLIDALIPTHPLLQLQLTNLYLLPQN